MADICNSVNNKKLKSQVYEKENAFPDSEPGVSLQCLKSLHLHHHQLPLAWVTDSISPSLCFPGKSPLASISHKAASAILENPNPDDFLVFLG